MPLTSLRLPRRRVLLAATAAAAVALTAACGSSSGGASEDKSGDVTITGYVWSDWTYVFDAAKAFEKSHPGVTVKLNAIPGGDYFNTLPNLLASSDTPDFTVIPHDATTYPPYVEKGLLANLDDVWQKSGLDQDAIPSVKTSYTSPDGNKYAISAGLTGVPVIYYNKAMFKEAGITPPSYSGPTMDEFYKIAAALKADGHDALAAPVGQSTNTGTRLFGPYIVSSCGADWVKGLTTSPATSKWTDPCVAKGLEVAKDWADKGVLAGGTGASTVNEAVSIASFAGGKAGMLIDGTWAASQIRKQNPSMDVGWFLAPSIPGSTMKMTLSDVDALAASAKSPHLELTKEFLTYLAQDPNMWQHGIPPRSGMDSGSSAADPLVVETGAQVEKLGTQPELPVLLDPAVNAALDTAVVQVLVGAESAQAAAQSVQDAAGA